MVKGWEKMCEKGVREKRRKARTIAKESANEGRTAGKAEVDHVVTDGGHHEDEEDYLDDHPER